MTSRRHRHCEELEVSCCINLSNGILGIWRRIMATDQVIPWQHYFLFNDSFAATHRELALYSNSGKNADLSLHLLLDISPVRYFWSTRKTYRMRQSCHARIITRFEDPLRRPWVYNQEEYNVPATSSCFLVCHTSMTSFNPGNKQFKETTDSVSPTIRWTHFYQ